MKYHYLDGGAQEVESDNTAEIRFHVTPISGFSSKNPPPLAKIPPLVVRHLETRGFLLEIPLSTRELGPQQPKD